MFHPTDTLVQAIDKLVEELARRGILHDISPGEKQTLKENVFNIIYKTNPDLLQRADYDATVGRALTLTIISTYMSKKLLALHCDPAAAEFLRQFKPGFLFDKELLHNPKELEKAMKKEVKTLFMALMLLQPKGSRLNEKILDEIVDELVAKLMKKLEANPSIAAKQEAVVNAFDTLQSLTYRAIFGGIDPRFIGEVYALLVVPGNFMGLVDYGPGESSALIDAGSRVDPTNYAGLETRTILDKISMGAIGGGLAEELRADGYLTPDPKQTMQPR